MADIGIRLTSDKLVLTRGRDFKWTFDNLDDSRPPQPIDYPAGDLYFELDTGGEHNALQEVTVNAASGGVYGFKWHDQQTTDIAYDAVTHSSHNATTDIQSILEAHPAIGAGNVKVSPAKLRAVWEITLTLNNGNNEKQQIIFSDGATGTYKLGYAGAYTPVLTYNGQPATGAAAVQTALANLAGIGASNVVVRPIANGYEVEFVGAKANTNMQQILASGFGFDANYSGWLYGLSGFSTVKTATVIEGTSKFTDAMVNLLNTSINDYFNSFEASLGVDLDYKVIDNLNTTITATSLATYTESSYQTYQQDVSAASVMGWLNSVSTFFGIFATIHVDFYWKRVYTVELLGALGEKPQPALEPITTGLTGLNNEQSVTVRVVQPGLQRLTKWPFVIDGSRATIKIESEVADEMPEQTPWQLVFLPAGEPAGGEAIGRGSVVTQQ